MTTLDIIRAWKDEDYRLSLSVEQRALLPDHPAGIVELAFAQRADVYVPDLTGEMALCTATEHIEPDEPQWT